MLVALGLQRASEEGAPEQEPEHDPVYHEPTLGSTEYPNSDSMPKQRAELQQLKVTDTEAYVDPNVTLPGSEYTMLHTPTAPSYIELHSPATKHYIELHKPSEI